MRQVFSEIPADQIDLEYQRGRLINTEPDLRARALSATMGSVEMLIGAVAESVGRAATDFEVRNLVGAVFGAMFTAWQSMGESDGPVDMVATMDAALAHLEAGLPI